MGSNYIIADGETITEMGRLDVQHEALKEVMGGLFPNGLSLTPLHRILDLACGPGSWVLDVAKEYPTVEVYGVDKSEKMIQGANSKCGTFGMNHQNAFFRAMDVTENFDYPSSWFDLVHGRLLFSFMRRDDWPHLIRESFRVLRPGGLLQLVEGDSWNMSDCPAITKLASYLCLALWRADRSFCDGGFGVGVSPKQSEFLEEAGFESITQRAFLIDASYGAKAYRALSENFVTFLKLLQPFFLEMQVATLGELNRLYAQAVREVYSQRYHSHWFYVLTQGRRPL